MKFIELTITTTPEAEELISDKLWEYTAYGVAISNDNDVLELINKRRSTWDYLEDELTENLQTGVSLVKAYLDLSVANEQATKIEKEILEMKKNGEGYIDFGSLELVKREVDGDDWIEIWRKHYRPIPFGKIVICPEWIDYEKKEGQEVVKLDSNMAFGTGEHETTAMCIQFLEKYVSNSDVVIDVGCGSGILGISAIKLGAKKAVLTDIDEVAIKTSKHNAKLNGVEDKCFVSLTNLLCGENAKGNIVVANITADVLEILAEDIKSHLLAGGKIILSGILKDKAKGVVKKYSELGFSVCGSISSGEWVALALE